MKIPRKSLIFLSQVYYPDSQATSQLFSAVMERLAQKGYKIKVICGFPDKANGARVPLLELRNGVQIERVGFRFSVKKNILQRAVSYISFLFFALFKLLYSPREIQIFAVTNPPFLAWVLALVNWIKNQPFIFMFLDLHPEGLIALGLLPSDAWYIKCWKYINKISYQRARKLFVLGRDMIPILSDAYEIDPIRFHYIPLWSSAEAKSPIAFFDSRFPQIWGVASCFVIQYSGNMGLWHDIETFVRAAKQLEVHKNIQFIFIGGGIRKVNAIKLSNELCVKNIQWKDFIPLGGLQESLAGCHIALISLNKNLEGVAVPSKLYGILSSGRPIVAQVPSNSEVAMTLREHHCGIVVDPGDVSGLADAIYRLSKNPDIVSAMSAAAFSAYFQHYKIENAIDAFERELLL
jgi:colanic acid biosynthesis glycosyl transferase WcaI